jgi:broad specificity phosphatase PhoE
METHSALGPGLVEEFYHQELSARLVSAGLDHESKPRRELVYHPFRPSWGEPYTEIAARIMAAVEAARDAARGHEALAVSHQLPIWTARSLATGRRLWHDPRKRQCALASLTSFTYLGDDLVSVSYEEPARDLLPAPAATGKKFVAGA